MTTNPEVGSSQSISGLAVVDKPAGWTSHQVVGRVRRLTGIRKVGHAGTLDPMATGVLVIGIGRATRLLGHLMVSDKAYEATIRLGISTVTDDAEGQVSSAIGATAVLHDRLETAIAEFRGERLQVPSAVSAIKISGVRSYAKVRSGHDVALAPRPVIIRRFEVLGRRDLKIDNVDVVDLDVVVECSSGTYIRALARDLGAAMGTGGHLTRLRRTRVGPFGIAEAQTLDEAAGRLVILTMSAVAMRCFATYQLDPEQSAYVQHGRPLRGVSLPAAQAALLDHSGEFLALYRQAGSDAVAVAVLSG
jgi:tRNA pseudouridine55 synthase